MKNRDSIMIVSFMFIIFAIFCVRAVACKYHINDTVNTVITLVGWMVMGVIVFSRKTSRVACKENLKKYVIILCVMLALIQMIIICISMYMDNKLFSYPINLTSISLVRILSVVITIIFRENVRHYMIHSVKRNNRSNMVYLSAIAISFSQINVDTMLSGGAFSSLFVIISLSVLRLLLFNLFVSYLVWLNGAKQGIIYSMIMSVIMFVSIPLISITTGILLISPLVSIIIFEKCYDIQVEQKWCKSKRKIKTYRTNYQYSVG